MPTAAIHMAQISYRSLVALTQTASSSRVLNLNYVNQMAPEKDASDGPFFASSTLNRAIVIKHRLRTNEVQYLDGEARNATKVIIPLVAEDLKLGGQSFFVKQRGFRDLVASFHENDPAEAERDGRLLELLDSLPSLDPFLLKERLDRQGFGIGPSYFAISEADQRAMNNFVSGEIEPLVRLSFGHLDVSSASIDRIARKVLDAYDDDEVAPIRKAFRMTADEYRLRAFSWKGFLYYKWKMGAEMPLITAAASQINALNPSRLKDQFLRESIVEAKKSIVRKVHLATSDVFAALRLYENAFQDFVRNQDVQSFQSFLTLAPTLFVQVGARLGVLSHIQSYWTYRFPPHARIAYDYDELNDLLQEMAASLEFDPLELEDVKHVTV